MPKGVFKRIIGVNCGLPNQGFQKKHQFYGDLSKPSYFKKGIRSNPRGEFKVGENIGEEHPLWKGEDVGYQSLHGWVRRNLGTPETCEFCGKSGLKGNKIHWANIDHTYQRNLVDWIRLCAVCHRRFDIEYNNLIIDNRKYVKSQL